MKTQMTVLVLAIFILIAGCASESVVDKNQLQNQVAPTEVDSAAAEPLTRGNSYRGKLSKAAMRGLSYETGRVVIIEDEAKVVTQGLRRSDASELFGNGNEQLRRGQILAAIKSFTASVILEPSKVEYLDGLGRVMLAKRKYDKAEAAFRSALDQDETFVNSWFELGFAVNARGRLQEAMECYEKTLQLQPDHAAAHSRLAVLHYYSNQFDDAHEHLDEAERLGFAIPTQLRVLLNGGFEQVTAARGGAAPIVGPQRRVDLGNNGAGNETTAAAHGNRIIAGWNDYRTPVRAGFSISSDGGTTWGDFLLRPPAGNQSSIEGDPMTAYDARTGDLWAGAISFGGNGGVYVARMDAGSNTFNPSVMAEVSGGADKAWMAAGVDPNDPNATRLYIGYNEGYLISTNRGDSWSGPFGLPEFGLGWCPRVGPEGELYMCYWDVGNGVKLVRSLDGGNTISGPINIATRMDVWGIDGTRFPGNFRVPPLTTMAVDPNSGTLYVTYFDTTNIVGGNRNVDIYFCKSTDKGLTWTSPVVINGDNNPPGDQFFPWLEVDETGRISMVFYDTRAVPQNDGQFGALIEAYYSYSDDEGASWNEIVLTDQPFNSADDGFGDGFLGDYLGMGVFERNVYPCYLSTHEGISNVYVHTIENPPSSFAPTALTFIRGMQIAGDLADLGDSDDSYLVARPGFVLNNNEAPIRIDFLGTASTDSPTQLEFLVESNASTPNIDQTIELFNYDNGSFDALDTRETTFNVDAIAVVTVGATAADYVEAGSNQVNSQVSWKSSGLILQFPWTVEIDQIQWSE